MLIIEQKAEGFGQTPLLKKSSDKLNMIHQISLPSQFPVSSHTDFIGAGSTFVAIKGTKEDGIAYIKTALERGATHIVIDETAALPVDVAQAIKHAGAQLTRVENPRRALAQLSAQALGYPSQKLKIIGITGTKGKTTTTFLLEHLLNKSGFKTALLSTVKNKILDTDLPTTLTTQHPDYLHVFFDTCVKADVTHVVMEVAAQAVTLHRTDGLLFDGAIFTNFDQEHGEFYQNINDYFAAKCAFFAYVKQDAPILVNTDNSWCAKFFETHYQNYSVHSFGKSSQAQLQITNLHVTPCVSFDLHMQGIRHVSCPALVGDFNSYNIAASVSMAFALGAPMTAIHDALQTFTGVPGRLERYTLPNGAMCVIDYAHNPSSIKAILSTLRPLTDHLIVVTGAGGERDATKRPLMGAAVAQAADVVVFTSDNPRSECPLNIIEHLKQGIDAEYMHKVNEEVDREAAITKAYQTSRAGSIIALLGKGPDEYQIVGDTKTFFSEKMIIKGF